MFGSGVSGCAAIQQRHLKHNRCYHGEYSTVRAFEVRALPHHSNWPELCNAVSVLEAVEKTLQSTEKPLLEDETPHPTPQIEVALRLYSLIKNSCIRTPKP